MLKALQWGVFVFVFGALVVSMSIASFTYARYLDSRQVRNYLGYRIANPDPPALFSSTAPAQREPWC
jgi:hypothetical protein